LTKKGKIGWNNMCRLKNMITSSTAFKITILKNVDAIFIGVSNVDNIGTAGFFKTMGI